VVYWSLGCYVYKPVFPLSCSGARPRTNWDASAHNELLPRSWNFSIFIVNILIVHITKRLLKCRAVVRSCENFLLEAVGGSRSCEKKQRERWYLRMFIYKTSSCTCITGWGTALQTGKWRVRFPMVWLEFFIHIILPATLLPWGRLSLKRKWVPGNISWGVKAACAYGWQPTTFMCRLSSNLGASTSWNPLGLSRSVMGLLYLTCTCVCGMVKVCTVPRSSVVLCSFETSGTT
jgi:hypothetical protein